MLVISGGSIFNGGAYGKPGEHNGLVVRAGTFVLSGVTIRPGTAPMSCVIWR